MQTSQDNLDDEAEAYQNAIQDRVDAQIKGLQREQEARMNALRERAEASGVDITAQIYAIRDEYDARIDAIRDAAQRELKARRRLDRDRLQDIRDNMDDRKEAELAALEANFKETQPRPKLAPRLQPRLSLRVCKRMRSEPSRKYLTEFVSYRKKPSFR